MKNHLNVLKLKKTGKSSQLSVPDIQVPFREEWEAFGVKPFFLRMNTVLSAKPSIRFRTATDGTASVNLMTSWHYGIKAD